MSASPAVLGWLAALVAGAFALAAAVSAKALKAPSDLTEPRTPRGPTEPLEPATTDRRGALVWMWQAALGAVAVLGFVPFLGLVRRPVPRTATAWYPGARLVTPEGVPVRAGDVALGGIETVFPEGHVGAPEAATLLLRIEDGLLRVAPERADWSPQGNVAYSKICTHAGCPVAIYRQTSYQLYCPCHQSVFDVLHGARPLSGPATRALPQLALDVDAGGYLVARGDYVDPVGPDSWWRAT